MAQPNEQTPGEDMSAEQLRTRLAAELYRFDCPSPDQLFGFVTRTLDGKVFAQVQTHLDECASCREEIALLRQAGAPIMNEADAGTSSLALPARFVATLVSATAGALVFRGDTDTPLIFAIDPPGWEVRLSHYADSHGYVLSGQLIGPAEDELTQFTVTLVIEGESIDQTQLDDTGYFSLHCPRSAITDLTLESPYVRIAVDGIKLGSDS